MMAKWRRPQFAALGLLALLALLLPSFARARRAMGHHWRNASVECSCLRAMMAKWRRPQFAALGLLALLALLLPSFAWACPVMGRTGAAATTCNCPANGGDSATPMPCCAQMQRGQCCKPTSQLPGSDSSKDTSLAQPHGGSRSILMHLTEAAHAVVDTALVYPPAPHELGRA